MKITFDEMLWHEQPLHMILEDIVEEYVEHVGQPQDLNLYIEMINKPKKRDNQIWPVFIEFACEIIERMLRENKTKIED